MSVKLLLSGLLLSSNPNSLSAAPAFAQRDTAKTTRIEEVVITSERAPSAKAAKPLSTVDEYLDRASSIHMIRRGAYAWEPYINGMASERTVVTIDGMRIYGACTDKMDPVTSYVEITNLAKAEVYSGQAGSSSGSTIGGSLDLVRKKGAFGDAAFRGSLFSGFEANNEQKIVGTNLSYRAPKYFVDVDFTHRNAENYKSGGGEQVLYSQFTKYNASAIAGYKIDDQQHIEASLIYDRAVDVGYPALPMDVSLAKAILASAEYVRHPLSGNVKQWQTKVCHNAVTHIMDDTQRPEVAIRMDMPGWSKTTGFYSQLEGEKARHQWKVSLSGHHNRSLAEMTMYSNNPAEKDMFMLTWPGVHTNYGDLFVEDRFAIADKWEALLSVGIALHNNRVTDKLGLESLQIFYPEMGESNTRLLKRASASLQRVHKHWQYTFGLAYGERAPSVSEGYGYYLFNSYDRFDYIGNPNMKNEKSAELNATVTFATDRFAARLNTAAFYLRDYIIGAVANDLQVMTIGAEGVKVYEQLPNAFLFNSSLEVDYRLSEQWTSFAKLSYHRGRGKNVGSLPLMQPFGYQAGVAYAARGYMAELAVAGADRARHYNANFGERAVSDYAIANLSLGKRFELGKHALTAKLGAENLLDKAYTTFADWNRIPRMGRNLYANLMWSF